ncbi:cryptochrome/photolyase family protein (plasmid) [Shinella yambaruensis]|uniref:cryptochrome/photolyase family protein n=1 Tax=Shinella yambaruensis TaxID=415996 RepID=UPI003D797E53
MSNLILILGDQLTLGISSLDGADKEHDTILMCEVMAEATYVGHHKKKIAFLFSAMRHFAEELRGEGYRVRYTRIDDENNGGSFSGEVKRALEDLSPSTICVTEAGEWRVKSEIETWASLFGVHLDVRTDRRFIASHDAFQNWASGRRVLTMEYFYREMRLRSGPLPRHCQNRRESVSNFKAGRPDCSRRTA